MPTVFRTSRRPPAILFHGTGIYALAAILHDDELLDGIYWGRQGEPHGPRTSGRFDIASGFIEYAIELGAGGVLALDSSAIRHAGIRIRSYRDVDCMGVPMPDEDEFAIETPSLRPLHRYLRGIVCNADTIAAARSPEYIRDAQVGTGWVGPATTARVRATMKALDKLESHPLRVDSVERLPAATPIRRAA